MLLLALPIMAQDLNADFAKMVAEINQGCFDKAKSKLSTVYTVIREKTGGSLLRWMPRYKAG